MEETAKKIPVSLHKNISEKLINVILDTGAKNAIPSDMAKKIIYLWRQDQLATPTGIETLLEASIKADSEKTYSVLDELGLQEITLALKV
jgi:23S rRNA U2552 (ribose-2'-O)-methylase RlmE/FtsJ